MTNKKLCRFTIAEAMLAGAVFGGPFETKLTVCGYIVDSSVPPSQEISLPLVKISPTTVSMEEIFEGLIESRIVPGLFFNFDQFSITYGQTTKETPKRVFKILLFLERHGGVAEIESLLSRCWTNGGTVKSLKSAVSEAGLFLENLEVSKTVSLDADKVLWQ